jgi:DNA-binding transcriptional MerR regulator
MHMDSPQPDQVDLSELSDRTKISPRTIRYYIQQGLIPAPETRGPGAHYGSEHVDRLNLIRRLQREHLPLSEIRKRIEMLSPAEVRNILEAETERPPASASAYIRRVLNPSAALVLRELSVPPASLPAGQSALRYPTQRSQWERFTFAPDVEVHIRRPVSREDNRRIERLLEAARRIFNEESK